MAEALTPKTQPEVDRIVERMKAFLDNPCPDGPKRLSMSREDVRWVVAEIEGGREAFGTLVQTNAGMRTRAATMQSTIDTLMSMRPTENPSSTAR
ncbi:hypothetical protein [Azospira sp. I09]|uniref:hypothetical protein n=1 Tax=Azospira sp. I09 TaxID=1765049 RepID=UPI0012612D6A|nr:hypothetical protein [Azospira sp. I09]BBN90519.1 hypothetical protein AZSP09_35420 [Azospira sp. I09]